MVSGAGAALLAGAGLAVTESTGMTDLVPAIGPGGGGDRGGGLPPGLARLLQIQAESNRGGGGVPPGLFQAFSATNQRISSLEGAIGNVPTSRDLNRAVKEATTTAQTTVPTAPTTTTIIQDIPGVPGTPTSPPDGGGPSNTGPDLDQSDKYDLQDETGGGWFSTAVRTGGEIGHQAGQTVKTADETVNNWFKGPRNIQQEGLKDVEELMQGKIKKDPGETSIIGSLAKPGPKYHGPDPLNLGKNKGPLYEGPDPLNLGGNKNKKKKNRSAETSPGDSSPKSNSPGENDRKRLAQYLSL